MIQPNELTGIILAGGKSLRMGTDKARLTVGGETLLERAFRLVSPFCSEVIISGSPESYQVAGCRVVPDIFPEKGPMGGIYSCLLASNTSWNLVLSVDAPFVSTEFLQFMVSAAISAEAVVPVHGGKIEPLVGLYRQSLVAKMGKSLQTNHLKMMHFLSKIDTLFLDCQAWVDRYPCLFGNLNTPEDLHAILSGKSWNIETDR